ncbi:uncharacterized protein FIBRA_05171 [Fibroporia radiculosa]|uniref:Wax synthase domain-containing protein n=1 Tax=Fibroporia radiculosa TaxID=599839 RepID=J4HX27_9APHY|nr:uncharacterized protein FIBRA_05171 [Fibroporia radiculosa]CCM03052.1 predicted protein [Fibroporia radiculosa]
MLTAGFELPSALATSHSINNRRGVIFGSEFKVSKTEACVIEAAWSNLKALKEAHLSPHSMRLTDMTAHSRPALPVLPCLLLQNVFLTTLIALRPRWPARSVAFLVYTYALALALKSTAGSPSRDFPIGCMLMKQFFTAFHLLWLTDPLNEFRHERDYVSPGKLPFLRRMYWALCVFYSPRGVGWNYEIANVPPRTSQPRWKFVREQLTRALRWYLLADFAKAYQGSLLSSSPSADLFSVSSQGHIRRCLNILAISSSMFAFLALEYSLLAALFVALGWSPPRDWPDVYGAWSESFTIRRFWGLSVPLLASMPQNAADAPYRRKYHQLVRRYATSIGKMFCHLMSIRAGSWGSSYTQLYVGFAVSGLMHCGGDFMVGRPLASFPFFVAQAIAISLEDAAIYAAKRVGLTLPERLGRLIGYIWVFTWLYISIPWYLDWAVKAGAVDTRSLPFSLTVLLASSVASSVARLATGLGVSLVLTVA